MLNGFSNIVHYIHAIWVDGSFFDMEFISMWCFCMDIKQDLDTDTHLNSTTD